MANSNFPSSSKPFNNCPGISAINLSQKSPASTVLSDFKHFPSKPHRTYRPCPFPNIPPRKSNFFRRSGNHANPLGPHSAASPFFAGPFLDYKHLNGVRFAIIAEDPVHGVRSHRLLDGGRVYTSFPTPAFKQKFPCYKGQTQASCCEKIKGDLLSALSPFYSSLLSSRKS